MDLLSRNDRYKSHARSAGDICRYEICRNYYYEILRYEIFRKITAFF